MSSELDQIFESVYNEEVSILVIVAHISSVKPALAVNHLVWSVLVVQVTWVATDKVMQIRTGTAYPRFIANPKLPEGRYFSHP